MSWATLPALAGPLSLLPFSCLPGDVVSDPKRRFGECGTPVICRKLGALLGEP